MTLTVALRELRRNGIFFAVCFLITVIASAVSFLGMRILGAASLLSSASELSDYKEMLRLEGGFLFLAALLLGFSALFLAYLTFPAQYKRNLRILCELGAGLERLIVLFLVQTACYAAPATVCGIAVGELLIRTNMTFFLGVQAPLGSLFGSVYRVALLYAAIVIFVSVCAATVYFNNKPKRVRNVPRVGLSASRAVPLPLGFGALSFLRRRRPASALVVLCAIFICFVVYSGMLSYASFLNGTPLGSCIYDVQVTVPCDRAQAYEDVIKALEGCELSTWRSYSPHKAVGRTLLTEYSLTVSVLSDDDFEELAATVTLLPASGGRQALLQNSAYDASEHYRAVTFVEDTSAAISGWLSEGIFLSVVGYLEEPPLKYSSGYSGMTASSCRLFVRQSEFPEYGENDVYTVWFSGNSEEETQRLIETLAESEGSIKRLNTDSEVLGLPAQFIFASSCLFAPLVGLCFLLFLHRDLQSRSEELRLLHSLGMGKGKLLVCLYVDYLFVLLLLLSVTMAASACILRVIHYAAVGYYASFYMPCSGALIAFAAFAAVAFGFSLVHTARVGTKRLVLRKADR